MLAPLLAASPAPGQVVRLQRIVAVSPPGTTVMLGEISTNSPEVVLPNGTVPVPPARPAGNRTNAPAPPQSPEEKRLQELLKLKFNRSPSAILDSLADRFNGAKTADTNDVEQFRQRVVTGDWPEVGKFLRGLPKDHGRQVYRYLLRELPNSAKPAADPSMQGQPMQQGPANNLSPTLVPDDVLALAEASPQDLEDEDARLLGQLLARLLSRGDAIEPFLSKLERGVRRLGGSGIEDRQRAAELLVAANRLVEAGPFR
jgi:hypothetical protein